MGPRKSGCTHSPSTSSTQSRPVAQGPLGRLSKIVQRAHLAKQSSSQRFWTCEAGFSLAAGAGLPMFGPQLWVCQASPEPLTVCIAVSIVHLSACHQCTSCPWGIGSVHGGLVRWSLGTTCNPAPPPHAFGFGDKSKGRLSFCHSGQRDLCLAGEGCNMASVSRGSKTGFTSLSPSGPGGFHPILDLRQLNKYLKVLPFQMLMLRTLIQAIRPGDWFTTVDLPGPQVL